MSACLLGSSESVTDALSDLAIAGASKKLGGDIPLKEICFRIVRLLATKDLHRASAPLESHTPRGSHANDVWRA